MIQTCNLKDGFVTKDTKMTFLLWKHKYFKVGIPCHLFRKEQVRDIIDVMDIDKALNDKVSREAEINELLNKVRGEM